MMRTAVIFPIDTFASLGLLSELGAGETDAVVEFGVEVGTGVEAGNVVEVDDAAGVVEGVDGVALAEGCEEPS